MSMSNAEHQVRIERAQRRNKVLDMMKMGYTKADMAMQLGVSVDIIRDDVLYWNAKDKHPKWSTIAERRRLVLQMYDGRPGHGQRGIADELQVTREVIRLDIAWLKQQGYQLPTSTIDDF